MKAANMATDPFDDLLELENDYYKEGYDAGVADSTYAGMIEGKVFGIEKGYEKALELGKLHGRALIWQGRFSLSKQSLPPEEEKISSSVILSTGESTDSQRLAEIIHNLGHLPDNTRLQRHVEALHTASD